MSNKKLKAMLKFTFNLLINSVIVLALVYAFSTAYAFSYKVFANTSNKPGDNTTVVFTVNAGASTLDVIDALEAKEVISDKYVMLVRARLTQYYGKIMPGTYELKPSMTNDEILSVLSGATTEEE